MSQCRFSSKSGSGGGISASQCFRRLVPDCSRHDVTQISQDFKSNYLEAAQSFAYQSSMVYTTETMAAKIASLNLRFTGCVCVVPQPPELRSSQALHYPAVWLSKACTKQHQTRAWLPARKQLVTKRAKDHKELKESCPQAWKRPSVPLWLKTSGASSNHSAEELH